ncbi:MAG: DUF2848 family protein [Aminobacterium sp.]|uniref:DUF2848 family protein n=1 Tax=Aminobacterium sp. TaxID=1872491 RepID=UPI001BCAE757|nr:DUF2848 family protein [Aminobacterium sp.]MEA4876974.1 DUF2848 family protein [Aminobacterium sp.]
MKLQSIALTADNKLEKINLEWDLCVAIGYAGRNQESVKAHVNELRKIGVPVPEKTPSMYWIDPERISNNNTLWVIGNSCSGEIEFFAASDCNGDQFLTIASDHTDRALETVSVSKAKQTCSKIIGNVFWKMSDVRPHWDQIEIRSWVKKNTKEEEQLYQDGTLASLLIPEKLLELATEDKPYPGMLSYFSGTLPLKGDMCYEGEFRMELRDPVLNRSINHTYTVCTLPDRN